MYTPKHFEQTDAAHVVGVHRRARVRHAADGRRRPAVREPSAVPCRSRRGVAALPRRARESAVAAVRGCAAGARDLRGAARLCLADVVRGARRRADLELRRRARARRGAAPSTTPSTRASHVEALAAKYERGRAAPWVPDYDVRRLAGIVGIEIRVDKLEGKFKLSQNRSAADRAGSRRAAAGDGQRRRRRARAADDGGARRS